MEPFPNVLGFAIETIQPEEIVRCDCVFKSPYGRPAPFSRQGLAGSNRIAYNRCRIIGFAITQETRKIKPVFLKGGVYYFQRKCRQRLRV